MLAQVKGGHYTVHYAASAWAGLKRLNVYATRAKKMQHVSATENIVIEFKKTLVFMSGLGNPIPHRNLNTQRGLQKNRIFLSKSHEFMKCHESENSI